MLKLKRCPDCNGCMLVAGGNICKNCMHGLIVVCEDCKTRADEKGYIPDHSPSEFGLCEYILFQCPKCKSVEIINTYSKKAYEV